MTADIPAYSVTELVDAALAHGVPAPLMPRRGADVVPVALARLDGAITDFFGFEVHLARPEARVDTLVCVKAETGGRTRLALAMAPDADIAWQADLGRFLADWSDPATPWAARVANIWLEFDLVDPQLGQPAPSLFFGDSRLVTVAEPEAFAALLDASAILRGGPFSDRTRALACHALRCLPDGAAIFQIGQMVGRPGAPLRLCIRDLAPEAMCRYLADLGLGARCAQIEDLLTQLADLGGGLDLDLDVTDQIGGRIGLEWSPPEAPTARLEAEAVMFAWLVETGVCLPEKAAACRGWTALVHCRRHADLWPAALMAGDGVAERRATSCIARYLHHVKIVAGPDGHREAKAYLACLHRFVPDKLIKDLLRANTEPRRPSQERRGG